MSISCHKNGLVSSHQSVGRWFILYVLCSKNETSWLSTAYLSLYQDGICAAVFVHVGSAQSCTENGVSLYMCSAVEVAWLAQNIRHSSTRA